jgi:NAD(P)-dependent dehydrogenase (short-subunit alcohol dehydrogenase family)
MAKHVGSAGADDRRSTIDTACVVQTTTGERGHVTKFNRETTTDMVLEGVDLSGRRFVVTGAASGLGLETARALASHGAVVTVLARSPNRVGDAVDKLRILVPAGEFETGVVDLADLDDIEAFARHFLDSHEAFDVLINNAGVMACPRGRTANGFETQFGTNHLGHFALTARLAPALLKGVDPRVVTLTSAGHSLSDVDFDDPNFDRSEYSPWIAYGRSKTANALFARELARRASGRVHSFSVHPGVIVTDLGRHLDDELRNDMLDFARARAARFGDIDEAGQPTKIRYKPVPAGAATQVWAATDASLTEHNGTYLADCGLGVLGANPSSNGFMEYLLDDDHALRLWSLSEDLTGLRFLEDAS